MWGSTEVKQKWALVDWETICKPKRVRDLGLRDPEVMNKVLNAKFGGDGLLTKESHGHISGIRSTLVDGPN